AVSPVWETLAAVRAVNRGPLPAALGPWRRLVTPPETPVLVAVQSNGGYTPDFLTPPPQAGERSIGDEIAQVSQTPLDVVRDELQRTGAPLHGRPESLRRRIVRELELAWEVLLEPHWPRLHRVLATDVD